jgi:hypothetical protein
MATRMMDKRIRDMCQDIDRAKLATAQEGVTVWAENLLDENEALKERVAELEKANAELAQLVHQSVEATQVEQEPVAWINDKLPHMTVRIKPNEGGNWVPVFLHPTTPEGMARWKGLLVQDVGFSHIDRKCIPSVLLSFAEDDFDTRDAFVAAAKGEK